MTEFWERLKARLRSRTYWLALMLAVLGAMEVAWHALSSVLSPAVYGWTLLAISVAVAVLREVTTTAIANK